MCKYVEDSRCSLGHHCVCHPISAVEQPTITFNQSSVIDEVFSKKVELTAEPYGYSSKEY